MTCGEEVERAVKAAVERFGALDILVNNAGIVERDTLLEDMPEEVWYNVLNVNLNGVFLNCKYALPYLRESHGCVVSMSSISGLVATKNDPAYCASKTAIVGLTRAIAADYAQYGVRANAVCPTICETPLFNAYASMTAHIWSTILCILLAFMPALVGMYGAAVYGVSDSSIFFTVAMDKLPALVSAIAIAAIIAAIMSTIDSMMIGFSTVLLKNIYKGIINPKATEKTLKLGDTIISVAVAVVALLLSLQFTNIISLLSSTYTFLSACCLVPFVGGLFWKRGTARGAVVSSVVGLILVILSLTKILVLPLLDLTPVVIALIVYVVVSLLDKEGQQKNAARMDN